MATIMTSSNSEYGEILTDGQGRAVYLFTQDTGDTSTCTGTCAERWPPVLSEGDAMAGTGVDQAMLGTTTREDGTTQVTYNGHPLYYYAQDASAGDVNGQGVGDVWYLLDASGNEVSG
jgi:predicted lipoprotein with Yx(FWY)xxD motif